MNNKTYFTLHAVIYAAFALFLFFIPQLMWPMYGLEVNDRFALFLSQHNSIFLGGIAIWSWLVRNVSQDNPLVKSLISGLLATNLLGVIITLYACIIGIFSGFGWSDPIFFAVMSVASLIQLKKQG